MYNTRIQTNTQTETPPFSLYFAHSLQTYVAYLSFHIFSPWNTQWPWPSG